MTQPVRDLRLAVEDGVATLSFDRPDSKVNLLASPVMLALDGLLDSLEPRIGSGEVKAILIRSDKPENFIAGADIDELAAFESEAAAAQISARGQEIFLRLARLPVPTIAAIRGTCVGGGLELALACDHRVAADHPKTRLGLPETRLGILPGLGGTVRLPRLIGLRRALDLILSGRQVNAQQARKLGLVDRVLDPERFDQESRTLATELASGATPLDRGRPPTLSRVLLHRAPARWLIRRLTRKSVTRRTKGNYPALPAALEVTVQGLADTIEGAHRREAEAFGHLAVTPECKNLIHVFQITEGARKRAPDAEPRPLNQAAVVGAGVMGAGIAELFAYQVMPVHLIDIDDEKVEAGLERARKLLDKGADRAGWSQEDRAARHRCLTGSTGYDEIADVDVVVEAVIERMDIKREVFRRLEDRVRADTAIATNTSALSVTELQEGMDHPGRACGLHFFNPPHRMPLVEVVRGGMTSDETLATAFHLAVRLGKTPVVVRDSAGFVVNRILAAYLTEAGHLLQTGMPFPQLDRLMAKFGMPMGPFRLLDQIGLDVVAEVGKTMMEAFGERFTPAPVMDTVVASGLTGRKGGRGFYIYENSKSKSANNEIAQLIEDTVDRDPATPPEAEERLVFSMVNEAARTLADAVVAGPESLDVAMIMGTGFPPFRGGLLRYADSVGLDHIAERLRHYASSVDPRFQPATALLERESFYGR